MDVDLSLDDIIQKNQQQRKERRLSENNKQVLKAKSARRPNGKNLNEKPYQRNTPSPGEMARAQGNAAARVYVHNLPYSHTWRELKDHFAQAGEVVRADIMTTKSTQRSRGCGLVEFSTVEEAQNAIETLNDSEIEGRKILVREDRERGDKQPQAARKGQTTNVAAPDANSHMGRQVFVNNLDKSITWQDLKDAFSPAGEVERADIIGDGRLSKGQGLILFKTHEAALKAIADFHEGELKNKTISVKMDTKVGQYMRPSGGAATTTPGTVSTQKQAREPREPRSPVPVSKRVYVHNLPYQVENDDLQSHFETDGAVVVGAEVMRMPSGRSKGCGIVEFETVVMAANAIETLNNSPFDGRNILVREDRETGRKETAPAGDA